MKKHYLSKAMPIIYYVLYIAIIIIVFDTLVLHKLFGFGYPRHYEQEIIQRYPAPYVEFTGKPNIGDHSEYDILGKDVYRDIVHVNQHAKEVMGLKIAKIIAKELQVGKVSIEKQ
jgi:hypothetical protein